MKSDWRDWSPAIFKTFLVHLNLNVIIIHPSRSPKYTECVVMALESVSANKSTQSTRLFSVLVKALYIEGGEMDKGCRERWSSTRLMVVFICCWVFVCRNVAWVAARPFGSPPPARQSIVFACNFRYVINYADSFSDNQQRKTGKYLLRRPVSLTMTIRCNCVFVVAIATKEVKQSLYRGGANIYMYAFAHKDNSHDQL